MGQIKKKNRGLQHHLGEHRTDDVVFLELELGFPKPLYV